MEKRIPVIIPAYEPDEKMIRLLQTLQESGIERIVVVDDGSGNEYRNLFEQAKQLGAVVLTHAVNLGKGRALKTAFNEVLNRYPEAIGAITADSDGQHTPACIQKCMEAMEKEPEKLILGCRNFDQDNVPAKSEWGNKITRQVLKYLCGVAVSDTQTGLRGIPAAFMRHLMNVKGERFEFETYMLLEAGEQKVGIREVPIETVYLNDNKGSHFNPLLDSARIYLVFAKFLFSSLSSCIIDLVLFALFCSLTKERMPEAVSYIVVSTVLARVVSAGYNFFLNYRIVFILDRSGSMSGLEADTVGGFNAMIAKQKKEPGEALISTVLFDDESVVIHDRVPVQNIAPMTERDYYVRGCTALLDAIGGAIHHIGNVHKYARTEDVPEHTLFVITTDGMENASRRYDSERVKQMIERQKARHGWEFLFLGANIDAVETAGRFGIGADRAVNYHADRAGTQLNYEVLSEAVSAVRCSTPLGAAWKERIDEDFRARKHGGKR